MSFFFIGFLTLTYSKSCPHYICGQLQNYKCSVFNGSDAHVQSCPRGYYCDRKPLPSTSYCEKIPENVTLAWPGESCVSSSCTYGTCNDTRCIGQSFNETCELSDECNPGLYCHNGICTYLLNSSDKGCRNDYDCGYVAGCMKGKCVKYFSIPEGEFVHCVGNRSEFCKSGACYEKYCLDIVKNDKGEGIECQSYEDCVSTRYSMSIFPVPFYSECKCGLDGKQYCQLFPGDKTMQKYRKQLISWIHSDYIKMCNTVRRFEPDCIRSVWKEKKFVKLMYYKYLVNSNSELNSTDTCVLKTLNPEYMGFYYSYNGFSSGLCYTLLLVLINNI